MSKLSDDAAKEKIKKKLLMQCIEQDIDDAKIKADLKTIYEQLSEVINAKNPSVLVYRTKDGTWTFEGYEFNSYLTKELPLFKSINVEVYVASL